MPPPPARRLQARTAGTAGTAGGIPYATASGMYAGGMYSAADSAAVRPPPVPDRRSGPELRADYFRRTRLYRRVWRGWQRRTAAKAEHR